MTPRRIEVDGFLCFRDKVVLDFAESNLWMLTGRNGSGKSAVFDAVTFALFGQHRGGSLNIGELINNDSDRLAIEFDFLIDSSLFRIRRTVKKTKSAVSSTQQAYRSDNSQWSPVPGTNRKLEFNSWVNEVLGLTYETFTSSVLLLQGRAERLIDSPPRHRFDVLAGIVDLRRYQAFHKRVAERRQSAESDHRALLAKLQTLPEVSADEIPQLEAEITQAVLDEQLADQKIQSWQDTITQVQLFEQANARVDLLRKRIEKAKSILGNAAKIAADLTRFRELSLVLPLAESWIKRTGEISTLKVEQSELQEKYSNSCKELDDLQELLAKTRSQLGTIQKKIETDESKLKKLSARRFELQQSFVWLDQFERFEKREAELKNSLSKYPPDLERRIEESRLLLAEHLEASRVLPLVEQLVDIESKLAKRKAEADDATKSEKLILAEGKELSERIGQLENERNKRVQDRELADANEVRAQTLESHAQSDVSVFEGLFGSPVCRSCGQALTKEHFEKELLRRKKDLAEAETARKEAVIRRSTARNAEAEVLKVLAELEAQRQAKREEFQRLQASQRSIDGQIKELKANLDRLATQLESPDLSSIRHELSSTGKLERLRQAASLEETTRLNLQELERALNHRVSIEGELRRLRDEARPIRERIGTSGAVIRQEKIATDAEFEALEKMHAARKLEITTLNKRLDDITKDRDTAVANQSRISSEIRSRETALKINEKGLKELRDDIPQTWMSAIESAGLADRLNWKKEIELLKEADVEQQAEELRNAQAGIEALSAQLAEENDSLAKFPDVARTEYAIVKQQLADAKESFAKANRKRRELANLKDQLVEQLNQRAQFESMAKDAATRQVRAATLAELVGPKRLQLHLVRKAEQQIVEYANAVLDRLSGGQLFLRMSATIDGDATEKALELEAVNRSTGGSSIGVAFLSGSQRFRVAVSLALGIGQYASVQHRPIETVIIDEGFGSLDRVGRQVMIQELQNLRGFLKCILLVSHQEEFADAFNDGYCFELEEGSTKVTRVQK